YQMAAARFYSESYERAKTDFDAISKDSSSPWHSIAPYLAVRAAIRQSGAVFAEQKSDTKLLQEASQRLQAILADPAQKQWHDDARRLVNLVSYRLEPLSYQHRLAREIARGETGEDFGQNVRDYTLLLDRFLDQEPDFPGVALF